MKKRNLVQFAKDYGLGRSQVWRFANKANGTIRKGLTGMLETMEEKGYFEEIGLIQRPMWEKELREYVDSLPENVILENFHLFNIKKIMKGKI